MVGSTLSPQLQREAVEYLDNLKRERRVLFSQLLCHKQPPAPQHLPTTFLLATSTTALPPFVTPSIVTQSNEDGSCRMEQPASAAVPQLAIPSGHGGMMAAADMPMDLTTCVAPANDCGCCNCILNEEACRMIGDVNDPTSLAAMILDSGDETPKDGFDLSGTAPPVGTTCFVVNNSGGGGIVNNSEGGGSVKSECMSPCHLHKALIRRITVTKVTEAAVKQWWSK